jgi:hypothetical protein
MVKQLYPDIRSKLVDFHWIFRCFSLVADENSAKEELYAKGLRRR